MNIRKIHTHDTPEWARMRNALWPSSLHEHLNEIGRFFTSAGIDVVAVFVLERGNGQLGGFIELNLRNYAEGSQANQVPYVEGWYVDADIRGCGYGKQLMQAAERWAIENGFTELASDAEIGNTTSIAAHLALGFAEVDRIVCLIKKLG